MSEIENEKVDEMIAQVDHMNRTWEIRLIAQSS
jgi:hypothetical protein